MQMSRGRAASFRTLLLATSAVATLGIATPSLAQTSLPTGGGYLSITNAQMEAQGGSSANAIRPEEVVLEPHRLTNLVKVTPEPEILIAAPGTPVTARDPVNITGIGQMIVDAGGGFIGTCTGTLINPRTVIFAAHCVNSRAATAYGANSGGTGIAFGFEANTRANAPGEVDELVRWLLGGPGGAGRYQTNLAQAFYNVNQVTYHPASLEPAARSFLYGDVALATLDTPAANIPTWALLFSPLTAPTSINATTGTGYNVGIFGYGNTGNGITGAVGSDFRRRAAENIIGALTDLQTFEQNLFGGAPNGLTQNLYMLDFDDPRRGQAGASPFDFNAFKDTARFKNGVPSEGITSQGDSGGPLVLQNFAKQLVIGVLSGGYTRFFTPQPANGYGTVGFYQPLYLYWDWIAANNPYHYVTARAGDGAWTDATRWQTTLDPAYNVLLNGQVVNGIPSLTGEANTGTSGDFGQLCFQSGATDECFDTATGQFLVNGQPVSTANKPTDNGGTATIDGSARDMDGVTLEPYAPAVAIPAPTLANGLPGATNFVPNNVEPGRAAGTLARYFDVTLTAAGTTTLSGVNVVIDRLTMGGSTANLTVAAGASLTTLINTSHFAGVNTVNGTLTSVGDYSLMGGALMGSGRVNAPFLTSMVGRIAPGTMGTIGTLTIGGNLILTSGSSLLIDLGPNGTSDRVAVVAGSGQTGRATLGGTVGFAPVSGFRIRDNQVYTILTAQGGITGTFAAPTALSAILTPRFTYAANAVSVEIDAGLYANVVDRTSPIQTAFAGLLDRNRGQYDRFADLYGELDLQNQATIRSQLEGFAPHAQNAGAMQGIVATDTTSRFIRNRMLGSGQNNAGGTIAMYGKPVELASLATSNLASEIQSDVGTGMAVQEGVLPESVAVYLAGGYIDGKGVGLPTATPTGRGDFDGYFIAAGVEAFPDETSTLGFAMTYSDLDGNTAVPTQSASSQLVQGTLYGTTNFGRLKLDAMVSAGVFEVDTNRQVAVGTTSFDLNATDRAFALQSEAGIGFDAGGGSFSLTPRASVRFSRIEFTDTVERGGGPALQYELGTFDSFQGRAGATAKVTTGGFRPYVTANYVHEFEDRPAFFGANFRGGVGPQALIALPGTDRDWAEVSGGVAFGTDRVSFAVEAETTIERKDVSNQAYKGTVTFRF